MTITTPKGAIVIKVEGKLGPLAAANFVALVDCHYYDGVIFHRLVPGFVIQGGDGQYGRTPNVDAAKVGQGGPDYLFADDPVSVPYTRGTVAMANSGPDTNGSQFFIVLATTTACRPSTRSSATSRRAWTRSMRSPRCPTAEIPSNAALDPVPMTTVRSTTP